ncbi:MAG: acylase [Cyclobacteriaceae bacterium]
MKQLTYLHLLFFIACSAPDNANPDLAKWEAQADDITIIRDNYGVPHIYGKTDADAVFGMVYAQCEDDFQRVERNYVWAIGRLAEVEGEGQLYSDLRARLFITQAEAIENYESSPDWLKKLCQAWADGINYYMHTHPDVKPMLLTRFEPWMTMYFTEGSIGGDIERVSTNKIEAFYGNNPSVAFSDVEEYSLEEPRGSNGIAISGQLTESGNAMLLINPHTTFYFRPEVHMVSDEGLNAYGAVTWGQFFIYQGFNEKTGWMHTSTYVDVIDEYIETISEEDGQLTYQYGDEIRPVESQEVTLKFKEAGELKEKTFTIYSTHHGPITHQIDGKWVATAMMWEPVDALQQSFIRTKQDGLVGFAEMMEYKTNSSNNTVYADADGNIAYYHGNFIPKRDVEFDFSKPVDGSNTATDWKGLHEVEEAIKVINPDNGWVQNCNSTPFTSAAENSPKVEDYPYYMATAPENYRGVHAISLLEQVDGGMTLYKLIELGYDPYLPGFEVLIPGLVKAYDDAADKDATLEGAIEALRNWDFMVSKESVAMSLAHFYATIYESKRLAPAGMHTMQRFEYYANQSPVAERLDILKETVEKLTADFGKWNTPWGEINRFQRINNFITPKFDDSKPSLPVGMASGNWGALAAYGDRSDHSTKKLYGTRGNSFVAVVEFGDKLRAKSLLAGGQSGNPDSPHFFDQAQMYADAEFKDVAFYREDVEQRAEETYQPGKRSKE